MVRFINFSIRLNSIACKLELYHDKANNTWSFRKYTAKFNGKRVNLKVTFLYVQLQGRYSVYSSLSDDVAPSSSPYVVSAKNKPTKSFT